MAGSESKWVVGRTQASSAKGMVAAKTPQAARAGAEVLRSGGNAVDAAVVTALVSAGLTVDFLHEWPFLAWGLPFLEAHPDGNWRLPPGTSGEVPLSFSLKATRASSRPI